MLVIICNLHYFMLVNFENVVVGKKRKVSLDSDDTAPPPGTPEKVCRPQSEVSVASSTNRDLLTDISFRQ